MGMNLSTDIYFGVDVGYDESWYANSQYFIDGADIDEEDSFDELIDFVIAVDKVEIPDPWSVYPSDDELKKKYFPYEKHFYNVRNEAKKLWDVDNPWWEEMYQEYSAVRDKVEETIPVSIEMYGNYSYQGAYVIALKGYNIGGGWDCSPLKLPEKSPTENEIENAIQFCESYDLTSFKDAQWLITASYG